MLEYCCTNRSYVVSENRSEKFVFVLSEEKHLFITKFVI